MRYLSTSGPCSHAIPKTETYADGLSPISKILVWLHFVRFGPCAATNIAFTINSIQSYHPNTSDITLNMERKPSSPPSDKSEGAASTASLPLPSASDSRRRSPRSDTEKLEMICSYMRTQFHWGISDFVKALASANGANNARRKASFVAAVYKVSGNLQLRHWI